MPCPTCGSITMDKHDSCVPNRRVSVVNKQPENNRRSAVQKSVYTDDQNHCVCDTLILMQGRVCNYCNAKRKNTEGDIKDIPIPPPDEHCCVNMGCMSIEHKYCNCRACSKARLDKAKKPIAAALTGIDDKLLASKPYVCEHCCDTHMVHGRDRLMCVHCPRPCNMCATNNGTGAYCDEAHCKCVCHHKTNEPVEEKKLMCIGCGKKACDNCAGKKRSVVCNSEHCSCYYAVYNEPIEYGSESWASGKRNTDTNLCSNCGFDHATEAKKAYDEHANLLVSTIVNKLMNFAANVYATKIASKVVHKCMRDTLRTSMLLLDPEHLYDKVRIALENEGVEIKW